MQPEIVRVEWKDAVTSSGWESPDKHNLPDHCITVGYTVEETKTYITIASTIGSSGNDDWESNSRITIPISWITSKKIIKAARKK